jgi:protein tyrosine phosphatase type IVA
MVKNNVTDLVRVCDPSYSKELVECRGIKLHDWVFPDGEGPPEHIVQAWLSLLAAKFSQDNPNDVCIATHCVAGLGRAPVLVAIALLESGMSALDAVTLIRECRRGAINSRQLKYLEGYRPKSSNASTRSSPNTKCLLM